MRGIRALTLSSLLLACGPSATGPTTPNAPRSPAVAATVQGSNGQGSNGQGSNGDASSFAQASNAFAFDLWGQLRERPGNQVVSPASIAIALDMTFAGARGETAEQMARVLHAGDPEALHASAAAALASWNDPERETYTLAVANRLFGERTLTFAPEFLALTGERYGAPLEPLDLLGDPEGSRVHINRWVEEQTRDRIADLIPPGALEGSALVLTNAIYFLADWQTPFSRSATRDAEFFADGARSVQVPTMHRTGEMRYAEADGVQILELPYQGGELAMTIVLPRERDGIGAVEARLDAAQLASWTGALQDRRVELALPKIRLEPASTSVAEVLRALGMPLAFTRDADFSGMAGEPGDLFLSDVFHKAFVAVDEKGTEAAAATAAVIALTSAAYPPPDPPVAFHADHPFLFFIRDVRTGAILFMARVTNPAA